MVKKGDTEGHTALYRKYRSRSLDEVVGQPQVTGILRRSLAQGKVAHAYLLTGPRGVGKTSIARILAHEINKLPYGGEGTHLDIIEIDAASNNGVDDVRELRDKVQLAPISAAKKVYIIDEVHMLSKQAFNALLKTLEEPPSHVVFILATTDPQKLPATIISRTQHFAFHAISPADLAAHLKTIAKSEGIKISDDAIAEVATRGDGSFRDSISLLDQLSGFADEKEGITLELVQSTLGLAPTDVVHALLAAVSNHDVPDVVKQLDEIEQQGIQPAVLASQIVHALRYRLTEQPQYVALMDALLAVPSSTQPQLKLLVILVAAAKPPAQRTAAAQVTKPAPQPTVIEAPVVVIEKPTEPEPKPAPEPAPRNTKYEIRNTNFDWAKLIEYTQKEIVALYAVLSKCDFEFDGHTLTLYAGRKFNKVKLDEPKYLQQLRAALEQVGTTGIEIVTLAETKPPADEKLAKVAEMMGGGKEVKLEDHDA